MRTLYILLLKATITTMFGLLLCCEESNNGIHIENADSLTLKMQGIWEYKDFHNDTIKYGFFNTNEGIKKQNQKSFQPFKWRIQVDSGTGKAFVIIDFLFVDQKDESLQVKLNSDSVLHFDNTLLTKLNSPIYNEFPELNNETLKHKIIGCWRGIKFNSIEIPRPHRILDLTATVYVFNSENQGAFIMPGLPGSATFWNLIVHESSVFPYLTVRVLDSKTTLFTSKVFFYNDSVLLKGGEIYKKQDHQHSYTIKNLEPESLSKYIVGKWKPINAYYPYYANSFNQNTKLTFFENQSGTIENLNADTKSFNWIINKSDTTEFPLLKISFLDNSPFEIYKIKSISCDTLLHLGNVLYNYIK
jgi:hypothetical protein